MRRHHDIRWLQRLDNFDHALGLLQAALTNGPAHDCSDVDLAIHGDVTPLEAESIASELDDLPLPYRFEVQPLDAIRHEPLRDHIDRVGICIYRAA